MATSISVQQARRLALCNAGLLKPEWSGLSGLARKRSKHLIESAHEIIKRFGYLQLDTVSVAGARSHSIVLLSRIPHLSPDYAESLLKPDAPLFEYWGHEASWLPMELYPVFQFRREAFRSHPWWGDLITAHPEVVNPLLHRIETEGPLRSLDMEQMNSPDPLSESTLGEENRSQTQKSGNGWWNHKITKKVALALWSSGQLVVRERNNFQRVFDLPERVIPERLLNQTVPTIDAVKDLLLLGLAGHGWASTSTLAQTWRLKNLQVEIKHALNALAEEGLITTCYLHSTSGKKVQGWIRPADLDLASRLDRVRPSKEQGVLLSPFDPILWDRKRVAELFGFDQILEIFKPAAQRVYGYYCLPVLAGDNLICRVDLKADQKNRNLRVISCHFESAQRGEPVSAGESVAVDTALQRFAGQLGLALKGD